MSSNFEELQAAIQRGAGSLGQTHLLSITLDPAFDTPQILKQYGASRHADPKIWAFVTGDEREIEMLTSAFSVYRQTEGGTISHGLATGLINKDGKIDKIWRGNGWTPAEVTRNADQRLQMGNVEMPVGSIAHMNVTVREMGVENVIYLHVRRQHVYNHALVYGYEART